MNHSELLAAVGPADTGRGMIEASACWLSSLVARRLGAVEVSRKAGPYEVLTIRPMWVK